MLQYSHPTNDLTQLVFQKTDSKRLCEAVKSNYLKGLRTSCPQCTVEADTCLTKLPSAYRDVFQDQPGVVPYVSAPKIRILMFGVELKKAVAICKEAARRWQEGMNQPAECIY